MLDDITVMTSLYIRDKPHLPQHLIQTMITVITVYWECVLAFPYSSGRGSFLRQTSGTKSVGSKLFIWIENVTFPALSVTFSTEMLLLRSLLKKWKKKSQTVSCFLEKEKQRKTLLPKPESQIPLKMLNGTWIVLVTPAVTGLIFLIRVHQEDVRVCKSSMSPWAWGRVSWIVMEQQEWQGARWEINGIGETRQRKWNNCPGDSLGCYIF